MFEGVGAPINVDQTDGQYIDPTLDSCCQREVNIHLFVWFLCLGYVMLFHLDMFRYSQTKFTSKMLILLYISLCLVHTAM